MDFRRCGLRGLVRWGLGSGEESPSNQESCSTPAECPGEPIYVGPASL